MNSDFYCAEVISGKTLVTKIVETENVLAFQHTRPAYPVHIVVIPKQHIESLVMLDLTDTSLLYEMLQMIQNIATIVLAAHGACRVITNLGTYQESKHLHWHIVSGERIKETANFH